MKQRKPLGAIAAFTFFILLVVLAVFSMRMSGRPPEIQSIEPAAAHPGDTVVIRGEHFGPNRGEGGVDFAGIELTFSHYLSWSDTELRVKVPHGVNSGRVYVHTENGRSGGVLFTNKEHIPVVLSGPARPGQPYIESISPEEGSIGTRVRISGVNFGRRRGEGGVYFRFLLSNLAGSSQRGDSDAFEYVAASELDYDYQRWSEEEIVVYVPDGAVSGSVHVRTERGKSNAVYFEVLTPGGSKHFDQQKGYQIQHRVQVRGVPRASEEAALELWIPQLYKGYAQRGVEETHEPEPMWQDYHGVMRYHLTSGEARFLGTSHTYWFDRYSIRSDIQPARLGGSYDTERALYRHYTAAGRFIPAENEALRSLARRITRGEPAPYRKAHAIYRYLLDELEYDPQSDALPLTAYLEQGSASGRGYGLLYVTLLRTVGIPARPVAGYLVFGEKETRRHVWAEFYLPDFGWFPVDPALGEGQLSLSTSIGDARRFYFGNLDNQHITFSRRVIEIPQMSPEAKRTDIPRPFSLQTVYEEYHPELEGYRSDWEEIEVVGWW
jgi:hypothetical protein